MKITEQQQREFPNCKAQELKWEICEKCSTEDEQAEENISKLENRSRNRKNRREKQEWRINRVSKTYEIPAGELTQESKEETEKTEGRICEEIFGLKTSEFDLKNQSAQHKV